MTPDRWKQLAAVFAASAGDASAGRLCAVCVDVLGVDGVGITLMDGNQVGPLCVSGRGARELEEMQFTLGEGPCHDAFRSGRPVLIPHLDHAASLQWLPFGELATRIGIGAVFAFPLVHDDTKLGVMTLYQSEPGPLTGDQLETCDALSIVLAGTIAAMSHSSSFEGVRSGIDDAVDFRAELHQASGMVAAQLDISAAHALERIRAHAFATNTPVKVVADDIIARRLRLADDRDDRSQEVDP